MSKTPTAWSIVIVLGLALLAPELPAQGPGKPGKKLTGKEKRRHSIIEKRKKAQLKLLLDHAAWLRDKGLYDRAEDAVDRAVNIDDQDERVSKAQDFDPEAPDISDELDEHPALEKRVLRRDTNLKKNLAATEFKAGRDLRKIDRGESIASFRRALEFDANNKEAREALGWVRHEKMWVRPGEQSLASDKFVRLGEDCWAPKGFKFLEDDGGVAVGDTDYTFDEADLAHSTTESPWRFRAMGMQLETTLPLEEARMILPAAASARRSAAKILGLESRLKNLPAKTRNASFKIQWVRNAEQFPALEPKLDTPVNFTGDYIKAYTRGLWDTRSLVRGTSVHCLLLRLEPHISSRPGLWLSFGVSSLFYGHHVKTAGRAFFDVEKILSVYKKEALSWLEAHPEGALKALEAMSSPDWSGKTAAWRDASVCFTAWLWLSDHRPKLIRYLHALTDGKGRKGLFKSIFKKPMDHFRKPFEAWLREG